MKEYTDLFVCVRAKWLDIIEKIGPISVETKKIRGAVDIEGGRRLWENRRHLVLGHWTTSTTCYSPTHGLREVEIGTMIDIAIPVIRKLNTMKS